MSSAVTLGVAPSAMAHSHSHSHLSHANSMASSSNNGGGGGVVINRPACIEYLHYRFLIHDGEC